MKRLALLVLAGCGGGAVTPDAAVDATRFELPTCPVDYDRVYVAELTAFLPPGQGADLDGDGDIDNLLGLLADVVNPALADSIANGAATIIILPGLQIPPSDQPVEITALLPEAVDADDPPDPSDNLTEAEFLLELSSLDASCEPRRPIAIVQDGTTLTGTADRAEIITVEGRAEIGRVQVTGTVTEDGAHLDLVVAGATTTCALERISFPGPTKGSTLAGLVAFGMQPDIDLDGDGLERIVLVDNAITGCVDGDGVELDDPACPCDPRIVDGFSAAAHDVFVPAHLVGTR